MKAFPSNGFYEKTSGGEQPQKLNPVMGMDLRDYFAAQVLSCVIIDDTNIHGSATFCYRVADAMMEAREK
jgi:hypothetical protein